MSNKRASDFVQALELIARRNSRRIRACVVGDGPRREEVETWVRRLPGHCIVDMLGFTNQRDMPAALQRAETLVFTSQQEAYGLIATEAAAAGLALVMADDIGCVGETDLARRGVNALTYKTRDVNALAAAMERLLEDATLRIGMQRASAEIAAGHDLEFAAATIESVVTGTARRA